MKERLGVIDLGSNTFHLLIVEHSGGNQFNPIFRKRIFTSLSEGGINHIRAERIEAGLTSLRAFKNYLDQYECKRIKVVGTAVLRTASNRNEFIKEAEKILGNIIYIIDGIREAEYIYKGITLSPEVNKGTHLVMDIGGGSTEFILIREGEKLFSKSYVIGVGTLFELFHKSEPISKKETKDLFSYIQHKTEDLKSVIQEYQPEYLTGASGSFEVLQLMSGMPVCHNTTFQISRQTFLKIYEDVVSADEMTRKNMEGLPEERVKLIVVGMILKRAIFDLVDPTCIYVSPFSLKEGILQEMF